jgi:hypothetical protein
MRRKIHPYITLLLSAFLLSSCAAVKMGELIPTEGKLQWIADDKKTDLLLFGDYEMVKDPSRFYIPHQCKKTAREKILLMAQTNTEPRFMLMVKESKLNMMVYPAGTTIMKDTVFHAGNGMMFRKQVIHLTLQEKHYSEVRYFLKGEARALQVHFWSWREDQNSLVKEADQIMYGFSMK